MKRGTILGLIAALGGLPLTLTALQAPPPGPNPAALAVTKIEKVKDNLYIITGSSPVPRESFSGGNTGIFITDKGVVVVDTKLAGWGPTILELIRTVTDKPVITLINTHTHGDHTGSNEFFGATVDSVVQENTKFNMSRLDAFKGDKAAFLPKRTYKDRMTLGTGKDRIELFYFGAGHTNGDAFVVYPALRTMQAGDLFPWRDAPTIDRYNGGSGVAWPATLKKAIDGIHNVDTVIGGHQPPAPWADLVQFQQFTADLLAATTAAQKAGKTVEEAVAAKEWMSKYPGYNSTRLQSATQAIYDELNGKPPAAPAPAPTPPRYPTFEPDPPGRGCPTTGCSAKRSVADAFFGEAAGKGRPGGDCRSVAVDSASIGSRSDGWLSTIAARGLGFDGSSLTGRLMEALLRDRPFQP